MTTTTIWRGPQVQAEIGFSRSTILRRTKQGLLPKPIALSRRSVGWLALEIAAVNAALIRGASEDDLRQLVRQLEESRKTLNPENTMSASALAGEARSVGHLAYEAKPHEISKS